MGKYRKTITALVTNLVGWSYIVVGSPSPGVTAPEVIGGIVAVASALGVYKVTNE